MSRFKVLRLGKRLYAATEDYNGYAVAVRNDRGRVFFCAEHDALEDMLDLNKDGYVGELTSDEAALGAMSMPGDEDTNSMTDFWPVNLTTGEIYNGESGEVLDTIPRGELQQIWDAANLS